MNILFVFYSFPGIGGVESVSNSLIDYLGQHYTIYTIAFHGDDTAPKSSKITESYRFRFHEQDKENNIRFFNRLTGTLNIDLVINQGMYPELTDIILNNQRKRDMKIISVLHGMPGYEKRQFDSNDENSHLRPLSPVRPHSFIKHTGIWLKEATESYCLLKIT